MELLALSINELGDFVQLARYIYAFRCEEDPKELKDGAYFRQGMGRNPVVNARFCAWKYAVEARVSGDGSRKYDIFGPNPAYSRISWPKASHYIVSERLTEVVRFIESKTPDDLEALAELYKFMSYFKIPIAKAACINNARLLQILAAMLSERGTTWSNQLRWFLVDEDSSKQKKTVILRSFADRWSTSVSRSLSS